jgi:5S rRNA maturation endonuclease (ribonuclease M5)
MSQKESSDSRRERFIISVKSIQESIIRNRGFEQDGFNCPILVEGLKDVASLRELGFSGTIETINRGWDRSRMIAYLYEAYGSNLAIDGLPKIILLMDWDRTGNRLQNSFKKRLESMDVKIDDRLRSVLSRQLKSECRTVEELSAHSDLIHQILSEL